MKDNMKEYSIPFAAWELRLYLNTHPDDEKALPAYRQLCAECESAGVEKCNYACAGTGVCAKKAVSDARIGTCSCGGDTFGRKTSGSVWSWIDGPWPWEPEANGMKCTDGCGMGMYGTDMRRGGNK